MEIEVQIGFGQVEFDNRGFVVDRCEFNVRKGRFWYGIRPTMIGIG